jgi:hypothetical protein
MNGRFACGSMVLFFSFSQNICTLCKCFVKKKGIFIPVNEMSASESRPSRSVRDGRDLFFVSRRQRGGYIPKYGSDEFTLNACAVLGIIQASYTHCQGEKDV